MFFHHFSSKKEIPTLLNHKYILLIKTDPVRAQVCVCVCVWRKTSLVTVAESVQCELCCYLKLLPNIDFLESLVLGTVDGRRALALDWLW